MGRRAGRVNAAGRLPRPWGAGIFAPPMFNHEIFAVAIARALGLLHARGSDPEQQKAALRAVHALTTLASATIRVYDGILSIDDVGIPADLPAVGGLIERMQAHGLAEVTIARASPPADLLSFLRALGAEPARAGAADDVKRRLGEAGAASIVVLPLSALGTITGRRAASVTQAFALAEIEDTAVRGSPGGGPPQAAPAEGEEVETGWAAPHGIPLDTPLGSALSAVARDPYGAGVLDRLAGLAEAINAALTEDAVEEAAQALAAIVGLEPAAPEGTPRSSYAITLRRLLTTPVLTQMAQLVPDQRLAPIASAVLQRAGGDGVEVLLGCLATAESIRERRTYMGVLRTMPSGIDRAMLMLDHNQWFVVRNVAELVGEVRLEEAVPRLGRLLSHSDARVQRAAAVALAKIASVTTVEPLRRALRGGSPELRCLVASSIGGAHARALAMPLVALAEEERSPEVQAEYYRALGRIGSAEAVEALSRAALPGKRLLGRRPSEPRVGAVEGLRLAGGPVAARALEELERDGDRAVREAAAKALLALRARET